MDIDMESKLHTEWPDALERIVVSHLPGFDTTGPLAADAELSTLGLDSLAAVRVLVDVENYFGIEIPAEDLNPALVQTLGRLRSVVERLLPSTDRSA